MLIVGATLYSGRTAQRRSRLFERDGPCPVLRSWIRSGPASGSDESRQRFSWRDAKQRPAPVSCHTGSHREHPDSICVTHEGPNEYAAAISWSWYQWQLLEALRYVLMTLSSSCRSHVDLLAPKMRCFPLGLCGWRTALSESKVDEGRSKTSCIVLGVDGYEAESGELVRSTLVRLNLSEP